MKNGLKEKKLWKRYIYKKDFEKGIMKGFENERFWKWKILKMKDSENERFW